MRWTGFKRQEPRGRECCSASCRSLKNLASVLFLMHSVSTATDLERPIHSVKIHCQELLLSSFVKGGSMFLIQSLLFFLCVCGFFLLLLVQVLLLFWWGFFCLFCFCFFVLLSFVCLFLLSYVVNSVIFSFDMQPSSATGNHIFGAMQNKIVF